MHLNWIVNTSTLNLFILFYILCSLLDLDFLAGDLNLDWLNSVSLALTSFHSLPSGFLPRRPHVLLQGNHHVRYLELTIVMWQYIDNCRRKICKIVRETTLFPKTLLPTPNPSKHTKCNKTQQNIHVQILQIQPCTTKSFQ